jgi:hypothetical protein
MPYARPTIRPIETSRPVARVAAHRRRPMDPLFQRFLDARKRDLQRISRHTRGEHSLGDVESEAWLMIRTLASKGKPIDLDNPTHQALLISHLYQELVRYSELQVRHAIRLDHAPGGEDGESHPLAHILAAADHYDPAVALSAAEESALTARDDEPSAHLSLAAAYLHLVRHFDNRMRDVAEHLLISVGYCHARCRKARFFAAWQQPLPINHATADPGFLPGAWRRFKLVRDPVQLAFDFGGEEALFVATPSTCVAQLTDSLSGPLRSPTPAAGGTRAAPVQAARRAAAGDPRGRPGR